MYCEEKVDIAELEEIFNKLLEIDFDKLPKWKYDEIKSKLNTVAGELISAKTKEIETKDKHLAELKKKREEVVKQISDLSKVRDELDSEIWKYECEIKNAIKNEIRSKVDKKLLEILLF